jgi:hypothetical protein
LERFSGKKILTRAQSEKVGQISFRPPLIFSFPYVYDKNSGVVVALARPTVTGKTDNDFSPKCCGHVLYVLQETAQGIKTGNIQRIAHGATVIIILYYM